LKLAHAKNLQVLLGFKEENELLRAGVSMCVCAYCPSVCMYVRTPVCLSIPAPHITDMTSHRIKFVTCILYLTPPDG
jgi:hypothetical protein